MRWKTLSLAPLFLTGLALGAGGATVCEGSGDRRENEVQAVPAQATQATQAAVESRSIEYNGTAGASLLVGAIAAAALPRQIYKTPPACRWCDGDSLNAVDRWARKARWDDPCRAAGISNVSLAAAAAVALAPLSHESRGREWLVNAGGVADSLAVTVMLTQVVKYTTRRARPAPSTCHPERPSEHDRNLSFFSGHAAAAFAMVTAAHETGRLRGRPRNEWFWIGGAAAATTSYLRVAGDRHHLIDVVTGAGVGYLVGKWVPHLNHVAPARPSESVAVPLSPPATSIPMVAYAKSLGSAGNVQLQVGKGPGRSIQLGIRF